MEYSIKILKQCRIWENSFSKQVVMNVKFLLFKVFVLSAFILKLNAQCASATANINYFTSTSGAGTYTDPALGNIEYGFCLTLNTFYESQTNWVHGVFISWANIPEGVQICQGSTGEQPSQHGSRRWIWIDSLEAIQFNLPGIGYYVDDGDGNPTNNYGDNGLGTPYATFPDLSPFCFIAKFKCGSPAILKSKLTITGDGTTGGWKNSSCPGDIIEVNTGGPNNDGNISVCGLLLPLELISFEGIKKENNNFLKWVGIADNSFSHYELEKKLGNESSFTTLQNFAISNNVKEHQTHNLEYSDHQVSEDITYYRLKMVEKDNSYNYSKIIAIAGFKQNSNIEEYIFPNPTKEFINIGFPDTKVSSAYEVELLSLDLKLIQLHSLNIKGKSQIHPIAVNQLQAGIYLIKIVNEQNEVKIYKFIKE